MTNFYTLNEVLGDRLSTFLACLYDYENLQNVPTKIIANYQDWYGLWIDSDATDAEVKQECINQTSRMTAWLQLKAQYLNEYIERQKAFTGKQGTLSKYLDTPETDEDYSGDTHVTNITKSETTADNTVGLDTLRPIVESLVNDFRRTWLLPKEAI